MANARRTGNKRKAEILAHAARLFRAQGYHATTMDDVADSVQINKGTLYYYYDSKASLLFEILLSTTEKRLATMRGLYTEMDPVAAIDAFIEDTITYLADNMVEASVSFQEAPFLRQWLNKAQLKQIHASWAEFERHAIDAVERGQREAIFDPDLDPRIVAQDLTGMVSWFLRWYRPGGKVSARVAAEQSSRLVLQGLLTGSSPGRSTASRATAPQELRP